MAPPVRFNANPAPKTDSAREARKGLYCDLCQKGYSRMNDYDAHQSSYEHNHRQRLKDMQKIQKDPLAAEKARKAEQKADKAGLVSIKLGSTSSSKTDEKKKNSGVSGGGGGGGGGGFKKGGFKTVFKAPGAGEKKEDEGVRIPGLTEVPALTPVTSTTTTASSVTGDEDERDYPGKGVVDWEGDEAFWNEPNPAGDYYDPMRPTTCRDGCNCPLDIARRAARYAGIPEREAWRYWNERD